MLQLLALKRHSHTSVPSGGGKVMQRHHWGGFNKKVQLGNSCSRWLCTVSPLQGGRPASLFREHHGHSQINPYVVGIDFVLVILQTGASGCSIADLKRAFCAITDVNTADFMHRQSKRCLSLLWNVACENCADYCWHCGRRNWFAMDFDIAKIIKNNDKRIQTKRRDKLKYSLQMGSKTRA